MPGDFIRQLPTTGAIPRSFWQRIHIDPILLLLLSMLGSYGLIVLYSASSDHLRAVERQMLFFCIGFVVMLITAQVSQSILRLFAPFIYGFGVLCLLGVMLFGEVSMGAQRWLQIPGLPRFQPSEVLKIALPLVLATYFQTRSLPPKFKHVVAALALTIIPVAFIMEQPDLGTSLLVLASGLTILFLAGLSWYYIAAAAGIVAAMLPVMWMFVMHDYQKRRVLMLLDPEADRLGAGWNIIQSQTAIGSGGFYGKGWMQGTQSQLDFLPEGHTDFIIAVLSEELGFRGVLLLMTLYILIMLRCFWISARAQDSFDRLLAGALSFTFFIYVFVNMGMVGGILPVVGVPLPLMSQGGTAMMILMISFGLMMRISTDIKRTNY